VEEVFADGRRVGGTSPCKLADSNGVKPAMAGNASFPDTILGEFPATTEKFEINYTATCLTASERVKFKFMMEGYDKDWVDAGNRRTAYYNNLPRGRSLRFRVIACNNDGVWNEIGAFAEFRITPFWWETWWFNGLFVLLGASTFYQGYRWRTRRLRTKAQELERLVEVRTKEVQEQAALIQLANTELSESNVLLQHLHKEKNEFLGIAAHDLKNPLAQIILSSGTMNRYYERMSDAEIQEHIQRIGLVAVRMREIISNLLDINALEQGGIRIVLHPFDLTPKVHAVVQDYAERAAEKQLCFSTEMEGNLPLVNADETLMVQVLDNLVSNAVKYSPPNKNIFLRLKSSKEAVRLEIQDEGPGFSEEDKEKLFGKFARLSARPTGGEHSTGLGLSIVKKMVEAMNGRVWCESELGNGATFIVELPSNQ
jgi:signal transduction histidine kinase